MKRRLLAICLVLTMLLPMLARGENVDTELTIGVISTRTTELRPLNPLEAGMVSLYSMVYESLVTIDDNGIPQPLLCKSWSASNDGKSWTFKLRDDIVFSDGTPLTAGDVVASLQYILTLATDETVTDHGFYQNMNYLVASASATDDKTVVVKAKRPYYGFLYCMTFPVVPAGYADQPNPVGTGPYYFYQFEPQSYMRLLVNDRWWQAAPQVTDIMVNFYTSNSDMILSYEYGRVDAVFTRSVAAAQYKSGISSLSIAYATRQMEVLLLNHTEYRLKNSNVRRAIRYAIDTNKISNDVYMGMTIDADTPIPSDSWLYYDQEDTFVYNPEKAAQLLADDGWTDSNNDKRLDIIGEDGKIKHMQLRLYVYEDPENNVRYEAANMIEDMLEAVMISVTVTHKNYDELKEDLKNGSFDMALCAFQMDIVPDAGFMLMKNNSGNFGRYVSSDMTSLFETLRKQPNQADFAYTWTSIQKQFEIDTPFICLFYRTGAILTRKMFTTVRSIREFELLRGIEHFGK